MNQYATILQQILKPSEQMTNGFTQENHHKLTLDFSNDMHFQCVMELFGGEETVKSEYPELYALANNAKVPANASLSADDGLINSVNICELATATDSMYSFGLVSLKEKAERIYTVMSLFHNGEMVGRNFSFDSDKSRTEIECESETIQLTGAIKSAIHVVWNEKGSNTLKSLVMDAEQLEITDDPIQEATFYHPVCTNTVTPKPIPLNNNAVHGSFMESGAPNSSNAQNFVNVCYDRAPTTGEIINYQYQSTRVGKNQQRIFLDMRGKFILKSGYTYDSLAYVGASISLGRGTALYGSIIKEANFQVNTKKDSVEFAFPTDWSEIIPSTALAGRELGILDIEISFYYKDKQAKKKKGYLKASSVVPVNPKYSEATHFVQLSKIKLNWGCVEEHTNIQMADGSQKEIKDIQTGDRIRTPNGITTVSNTIFGTEKELYVFKCYDKAEIKVSANHPMHTDSGVKMAQDITPQDKLCTEDGMQLNIEFLFNLYGNYQVYNLELDNEHTMISNGYLVGDNTMQGDAMRFSCENGLPNPVVQEEIQKLQKQFG